MAEEYECDGSSGDCERRGKELEDLHQRDALAKVKNERLCAMLREAIGFMDKLMWLENEYGMHEVKQAMMDWRERAKAEVG